MKNVRLSRYYLLLCLPVFLALVGLVWGRPASAPPKPAFGLLSLFGRYVSAETAYDISTFHPASSGDYVTPVFFAGTSLMLADGKGNVCGESDGFYGGTPPPGVNLGPSYFHGTYTVEANGRITITTCSDTGFCTPNPAACVTDGTKLYKTQVGYLSGFFGTSVTTVEQINNSDSSKGGCCATTGFLVHSRVWSKGF
jgi:hypothetical protein